MQRFEYPPPAGAQPRTVAVAGEFNNWSQTGIPMKPDGAGYFTADVKLAEGPHAYRFFVHGAWVNDSAEHSEADLEESNGIRGRNLPKPQPDRITVEGLHHAPNNIRYFDPPDRRLCRRQDHFPLERLRPQRQETADDGHRRGISAAVPAPHLASRFCAHPLLWLPR